MIEKGIYKTPSESVIMVKDNNNFRVSMDFVREPNCCYECNNYQIDFEEATLSWECDMCGGGSAELIKND